MFKQRATSDFEGPKRSLTATDYSKIRGATGYLFSRFEDLKNNSDFDSFMQRYQMDSRFWGAQFAAQSAGRQLETIELSAEELAHLLASAQTKPTHCEFDSCLKATKRCQVRIDRVETSNSNPLNQPILRIQIVSGKQVVEAFEFAVSSLSQLMGKYPKCPSGAGACTVFFGLQVLQQSALKQVQF